MPFSKQIAAFLALIPLVLGMSFNRGDIIELTAFLNARSSANFIGTQNRLFTLDAGARGTVTQIKKFQSGNYGIQIQLQGSSNPEKTVWVYYKTANPGMKLYQAKGAKEISEPENADAVQTTQRMPAVETHSENFSNMADCPSILIPQTEEDIHGSRDDLTEITRGLGTSSIAYRPALAARKIMATIYQSCGVLKLPTYNPAIHGKTEGIAHTGEHTNKMTSLRKVLSTHYYHRNINTSDRGKHCIDTTKAPAIYHYGGKLDRNDYTNNNEIDLFNNVGGRGLAHAGIDCSAFVSASFLAAGLRLAPSRSSERPTYDQAHWTSRIYFAAKSSNSCFNPVKFSDSKTIQGGDVIAWPGHVIMVESVSSDPFGVNGITSKQGCYTEVSPSKFNFTVIQSSDVFGAGIGVTRMQASDYFTHVHNSGRAKLIDIAKHACLAKMDGIETDHATSYGNSRAASIIRHNGSEECKVSPELQPSIKGEDCIGECK